MQVEVVDRIHSTLEPGSHPFMTGPFTPNYEEVNATDLQVIGEVPPRLQGVYLRNTQNPVHQPRGTYHPFDGDGVPHALHFDGGRVAYRDRFVHTRGFVEEQQADGALYAGLIDKPSLAERPGWGARGGLRDSDATDVIVHAPMAPCHDARDEGDGCLVSFVTDMQADRSECIVLDARDLASGPVARIVLPHRISSGTHACWADASEFDFSLRTQGTQA